MALSLYRPGKVYHKTVTFMQPKVYRAMQRAQGKMLFEILICRVGYKASGVSRLRSSRSLL